MFLFGFSIVRYGILVSVSVFWLLQVSVFWQEQNYSAELGSFGRKRHIRPKVDRLVPLILVWKKHSNSIFCRNSIYRQKQIISAENSVLAEYSLFRMHLLRFRCFCKKSVSVAHYIMIPFYFSRVVRRPADPFERPQVDLPVHTRHHGQVRLRPRKERKNGINDHYFWNKFGKIWLKYESVFNLKKCWARSQARSHQIWLYFMPYSWKMCKNFDSNLNFDWFKLQFGPNFVELSYELFKYYQFQI